jgi:hypothetical protein
MDVTSASSWRCSAFSVSARGVGYLTAIWGLGAIAGGAGVLVLFGRRCLRMGSQSWIPRPWRFGRADRPPPDCRGAACAVPFRQRDALVEVAASTLLQRLAARPPAVRVFGLVETVYAIALALGSAGAGLLVDAIGARGPCSSSARLGAYAVEVGGGVGAVKRAVELCPSASSFFPRLAARGGALAATKVRPLVPGTRRRASMVGPSRLRRRRSPTPRREPSKRRLEPAPRDVDDAFLRVKTVSTLGPMVVAAGFEPVAVKEGIATRRRWPGAVTPLH